MNLLVMENLCYDRRFSEVWSAVVWQQQNLSILQIYDLKGSTRNRHVKSTGRENEVLLDDNLVECRFKSKFQDNLFKYMFSLET